MLYEVITQEKSVANFEEIQSKPPSTWEEVPLILFTLLGQLAVGGFWMMWMWTEHITRTLNLIPHLIVGVSLGVGLLVSFAHLGTKRNAWHVLTNLRRSWLSREILFAGLFGLGWLITAYEEVFLRQSIYRITSYNVCYTKLLRCGIRFRVRVICSVHIHIIQKPPTAN